MIALSFSFAHHGKFSSYHRLLHYLGKGDVAVDASLPAWTYKKPFNLRGWSQAAWRAHKERQAYGFALSGRHEWIHYLYPEQGYRHGRHLRPKGLKIAMSCHLPQEVISKDIDYLRVFKEGLSIADALILMSPDDIYYYGQLAPDAKIKFIPHGIDIHHFRPTKSRSSADCERRTILTCGGMMRDFETLAKVIEVTASRNLQWIFQVITRKEILEKIHLQLSPKARLHFEPLHGLSDYELLERYQRADLLYLPLLNATANNAVLEAMACGLPMILSDFPATRAYAAETADYVKGRDPEEATARMESILANTTALRNRSQEIRHRAVTHFAWETIHEQQRQFMRDE